MIKWLIAALVLAAAALPDPASARIYRTAVGGINDPCGVPCAPGWSFEYWPPGILVGYGATTGHRVYRARTVRVRG